MSIHVTLVGSSDRELEERLKATGATVRSGSLRELAQIGEAGNRAPDVVVIDLRDAIALPAGLAELKQRLPTIGVVIVASRQDPVMMLGAMRAGVTEWVTDINHDELHAAIDRVADRRTTTQAPGKVYAFLGAKGGVGTTTIAVNVACSLKKLSSASTLIIDLHLAHGDAALFLGAEPKFSVVDAIQNPHRLDKAFFKSLVVKTKAGPDLLASSDRPVVGLLDSRGIASVIDFASRQYEYLILDVPRSDSMILDALDMVTRFTIVANQELATVRSASRIALMLRQRYGRDKVGIVVSRYDKAADIAEEDMAKAVGSSIKHMFPSDYRMAVDALNAGRPLVLENHSRLAGAYVDFTRNLAGITAGAPSEERSGGFFDIFGKRR